MRAGPELARSVALWLADESNRAVLRQALISSPYQEDKVSLRALLHGTGTGLRKHLVTATEGEGDRALTTLLGLFGDMEVYFMAPAHRAQWSGGSYLAVAVFPGEHPSLFENWTAFTLDGNRVPLSRAAPPEIPVLILHPAEGMFLKRGSGPMLDPGDPGEGECPPDADMCEGPPGGGGGPPPVPPPGPGYFMTVWYIAHSYEDWGSLPEFEITAYHWSGVFIQDEYGHGFPIITGPFYCSSGELPDDDPRDWYYNESGETHNAQELGRFGVQILDGNQVISFPNEGDPQTDRIPVLLVSENDDHTCNRGGAFPSAWDEDWGNDDDYIAQWSFADLSTTPITRSVSDPDGTIISLDFRRVF